MNRRNLSGLLALGLCLASLAMPAMAVQVDSDAVYCFTGQDFAQADLPGGGRVGAPAGHHFKISHGNDSDMLCDSGLFADGQGRKFRFIRKPAADGMILLNTAIN